jgi:hypothetical protein
MSKVGIRHAIIICLKDRLKEFLAHPDLLVELSVHGPISSQYFKYLMSNCPNIRRLSIVFNKRLIRLKPHLFPQQQAPNCIPKLIAIRFTAHTKSKETDLIYICDNLTGLITSTFRNKTDMHSMQFSLSHKWPSPYLQELLMEIIVFAHRNSTSLQEFQLNVIDNDISPAAESQGTHTSQDTQEDEDGKRRGTAALSSTAEESDDSEHDENNDIANFAKDSANNAIMEEAGQYLKVVKWTKLPRLKKINLCVNSTGFAYLKGMIINAMNIQSLQMEMTGGGSIIGWPTFQKLLRRHFHLLTAVKLSGIHYENLTAESLSIDLSVFKNCKILRRLHISCSKMETAKIPKVLGVSSLPNTLEEIEIGWMTISSWQLFRLLFCFRRMEILTLHYSCVSDYSFGQILFVLRFLIGFKLTKVQLVTIVDTKIKFRNKRGAMKRLTKAIPIAVEYQDHEQTLLIIDRGRTRNSTSSIPSICSQ